jgi:branched-chain amino acid aminotransferase
MNQPFGTAFASTMTVARWEGDRWTTPSLQPTAPLPLHPGVHALHYGSVCFEGLKAHRGRGGVGIFRLDDHVARMRRSAAALFLPVPPADLLAGAIVDLVDACRDEVPEAPGSLYLRPLLLGSDTNIGAATSPSREALLCVLASPVGDYFSGGMRALTLAVETQVPRTTPQFGSVKAGANYVMALGSAVRARRDLGADQVLFAPGGRVEEAGAANFLLIDERRVITPALTDAFLHGVTRDSVLMLARDLGFDVEEPEALTVEDLVEWAQRPGGEAALSGTAAVLAPVGGLVVDGSHVPVGDGLPGSATRRLRTALTDLHAGQAEDVHGWVTPVPSAAEPSPAP